jgi:hypothetical protein
MSVRDALPAFHHVERHAIRVAASPEEALAAARATRVEEMPLVGLLLRLRGLRRAPGATMWEALAAEGFRAFGEDTLVAVGRPWRPRGDVRDVEDFVRFDEPGWAKLAVDLRASPHGDGALLETETRVYLTDGWARRRFAAYWLAVRPFSGLVRRLWLRAAKRRAETR